MPSATILRSVNDERDAMVMSGDSSNSSGKRKNRDEINSLVAFWAAFHNALRFIIRHFYLFVLTLYSTLSQWLSHQRDSSHY